MKNIEIYEDIKQNPLRVIITNKWFWMLLSATLIGIYLFSLFGSWAYDDPFITYRYAENLRNGLGFVYNPGEKTLSTTTPLFTLLLALFGNLWSDLPHLANFIGVISLILGGVFLWDLAYTWKTPMAAWAGLLLYPTFPLLVKTLGSETPIYLAFCIATFAFYARRYYFLVGVFSALAILTRPDGVLIPIIIGLDFVIRKRTPIPRKAVIIFLVITISWLVFAQFYFGSPIPMTLLAKQNQGAMAISQKFAPGIITITQFYQSRFHYWVEVIFAIIGLLFVLWKVRQWLPFVVWPLMYFLSYTLLGVSRYFWYYAPLVPGFVGLVGLGVAASSGGWLKRERDRDSVTYVDLTASNSKLNLFHLLGILLILLFLVFQVRDVYRISKFPDTRYQIYRAAGEWLWANTSYEDQVGALEVGIIGYYAKIPIIDFAGLIQPEIAEIISVDTTYEDAAIMALKEFKPNFLVLISGVFPNLEELYVFEFCHSVYQFSGDQYGYPRNLDIYSCNFE